MMRAFQAVFSILIATLVLFRADSSVAAAQKVTARGGDFWSQTEFETKSGTFVLMRCMGRYVTSTTEAEQYRREAQRIPEAFTTCKEMIRTPKGSWIKGCGDYKTDIGGPLINVSDYGEKVFLVTSAAVYEYSAAPREELKKVYDVPRDSNGAYHISGTDGTYYVTFASNNVFLGFVDYTPETDTWRLIPYTGYLVKKESIRNWNHDDAKKAIIVQVAAFEDLQTVKLDPSEDIVEISFSLEEERFSGNGVLCLSTELGEFYPKYELRPSEPNGWYRMWGLYRYEEDKPWPFFGVLESGMGNQWGLVKSCQVKEGRLHITFSGERVRPSSEHLILDVTKGKFFRPWHIR